MITEFLPIVRSEGLVVCSELLATSSAEQVPWSDGIQPLSTGSDMPTPLHSPLSHFIVGQLLLSPYSWSRSQKLAPESRHFT